MPKFKPNPEAAQQKQADALAILEQGIQNLTTDEKWTNYLKTQSRFHSYSFNNVLMIASQCPDATRVAGYRAWQSMNRQVKKGEKGIIILAPVIRKIEDEASGETLRAITGFRTTSVFDISQTEGDELSTINTPLAGDDAGLFDALKMYAESRNILVKREAILTGAHGLCRFYKDQRIEIVVDSLLPVLHQASILAHELGHALMHSEAEYREHSDKSQRELEAESVAFVVMNHFGFDSGSLSFAYVTAWSGGAEGAITQLKHSGRVIQDAAHQIIEGVEAQAKVSAPMAIAA
jgi:antirestriction protein ArdC